VFFGAGAAVLIGAVALVSWRLKQSATLLPAPARSSSESPRQMRLEADSGEEMKLDPPAGRGKPVTFGSLASRSVMRETMMSKVARVFSLLILILAPAAFADDRLLDAAMQAYAKKDFARSADLFAKAFESGEPEAADLYNAACSSALAGGPMRSRCPRSVGGVWRWEHLGKDSDLDFATHPRWPAVVGSEAQSERDASCGKRLRWTAVGEEPSPEVKIAGLSRWSGTTSRTSTRPDLDWDAVYLRDDPATASCRRQYYRS
jgi:hypothetical protein